MTIEEMKVKKIELGYTNEKLAELSGVPLSTVQKIFAGITKAPRYDTISKLQKVLSSNPEMIVSETGYAYEVKVEGLQEKKRENKPLPVKPRKIKLGMFEGKYRLPPDELLYGDDLSDLFEDN